MLKVLEHILVTWPATHLEFKVYSDAIKELQGESMVELQRLAAKMPDHLLASLKTPGSSSYPLIKVIGCL